MGVAVGSGASQVNYPDSHPTGARKGWEPQYKKQQLDVYFTNDTMTALLQPLYATDESGTGWKQSYVYGANDERISMSYLPSSDESTDWEPVAGESRVAPNTTPETLYYLEDSLDSVLALLNNDDEVALRYHYDAFGVATDSEKFDLNYPGPDNLFGYTGLGYDASSGLSYERARYFDSSIGRFISQDTYEGELNNPLRYVDPTGHRKTGNYAEIELMLEDAMKYRANSQQYWKYRSDLGVLFKKIYKDKDNNQFKYLYGLLTQTSSYKNSEALAGWAKKQLLADLEAAQDELDNNVEWFMAIYEMLFGVRKVPAKVPSKVPSTNKPSNGGSAGKTPNISCNCFTAGTKVLTDEGEKNIEDIEVGDKVLAKSEFDANGELAYKEVTALYRNQRDDIIKLHVGEQIIETTDNHPFWVEGKGWVFADELQVGDKLQKADGSNLTIAKVEFVKLEEPVTVYNFTVADYHTYYVTDLGIWVHNTNCGYKDITVGKSVRNIETNVTRADFEKSLIGDGWKKSVSKDGKVTIYSKDGAQYTVRDTSNQGQPTAEFWAKGATEVTTKIRLGSSK